MDLSPHPQSLSDPIARVFESNGHIFRGISSAHVQFYEELLASSAMDSLFSLGLVTTERSDRAVDGYPLLLKHQQVDFVSDWREWPSLMLRDAAVMVCDLCLELLSHDYGMLDIHPWNVLFDFTRPVFIDFSAVVPLDRSRLSELAGRFRNYWILPLTFISMGHPHFARSMRKCPEVTEPIDNFLKRPELSWFPWWYYRLQRSIRDQPLRFFKRLKAHLEELSLPTNRANRSYCDKPQANADPDDFQNEGEARTVYSLLEQLKPKTLLDIGCGDGRYSLLAERMGARVVAFDKDEGYLNALYRKARSHRLKILPLLLDFSVPTPSHGRKKEFPSATQRLACEVSLTRGLIHSLVFDLDLSFERIANLLVAYTTAYSIVEFTPKDHYVAERMSPRYEWYRLENFIKAMERHFRLTGVFESESPRKILLFQKQQ